MDIAADKILSVFSFVFEKCLDILDMYALHFSDEFGISYISLFTIILAAIVVLVLYGMFSCIVHFYSIHVDK